MRYLILIGLVVAAMVGYNFYWNSLADTLVAGIERWIDQRRAEGYLIDHAGYDVRGFPFRLTLVVEAPRIARPAAPNGFDWRGDWITIYLQPWDPTHVIANLEGPQRLAWTVGRVETAMTVLAEVAQISLILDRGGKVKRYSADLQRAVITLDGQSPAPVARIRMAGRHNRGEDDARPDGSIDFSFHVEQFELPADRTSPLGRMLENIQVLSFLPPPAPAEASRAALVRWRDSGGKVDLRRFEAKWGPLEVTGDGTVALDRAMRPVGSLKAEIRGHEETLDALAAARQMSQRDAKTAKFAHKLLSRKGDDGRRFVKAPISVQDGWVYVGPVPILALPPMF